MSLRCTRTTVSSESLANAAGQCSQAPSVAMWTRCHRAGFRPFPHRNRGCYDSVTVSISAPLLLVFLRVESVRTLPKHDQVKLVGQWFRRHVQRHGSACWGQNLSSIWWTTCSWSAVLLDQPCCRPYTSDVGLAKLSLAGSAWWRRRKMRTGTRDKAVVQPVSLPSSRTETWGKLPGSPACLCARFLVLVSWCPGCVGGPGLWPSVPVLSVCPVSSCAPGLVVSSGSVLRVCFKKRLRPRAPTQRPGLFLTDRPRVERALRGGWE